MKQTFELQQEFEGLISELSRLKSINEITSENSNNAKKTIDEIESFVMAVSIFKTSVEKDYLDKKNRFEKFENTLETSLMSLEINIDKQAKRFEKLGNNYSDESVKSLENIDKSFGEKIEQFTQLTAQTLVERENNLSLSIQEVSKSNSQLLTEQLQLMNIALDTNGKKIEKFIQSTAQTLIEQESNLGLSIQKVSESNNQLLTEQLESMNLVIKTNGDKIEQFSAVTEHKLTEQENQIAKLINGVSYKLLEIQDVVKGNNQLLQEQFKLMNVTVEKNKKQAKNITILLVVLLVLVSLILVLRFK